MDTFSDVVERLRQSPAYSPIGIILGAIPWLIVGKIIEKIPYVDATHVRKTLLALLFTGAYVYMWIQGSNPHDGEIKSNTLADEMFLLLAGGYFLVFPEQQSYRHIMHDFLYVIFIILVIIKTKIGEPTNTYGFLVKAPHVFLMLSTFVHKLHLMAVTWAIKHLSIIVYFLSNIGICNLGCSIIMNEEVPIHMKVVILLLSIFQFLNIIEEVSGLMGDKNVSSVVSRVSIKCVTIPNTALCSGTRSKME